MTYQVVVSREAEEDLERLFDHAFERELSSPTASMRALCHRGRSKEAADREELYAPFAGVALVGVVRAGAKSRLHSGSWLNATIDTVEALDLKQRRDCLSPLQP